MSELTERAKYARKGLFWFNVMGVLSIFLGVALAALAHSNGWR